MSWYRPTICRFDVVQLREMDLINCSLRFLCEEEKGKRPDHSTQLLTRLEDGDETSIKLPSSLIGTGTFGYGDAIFEGHDFIAENIHSEIMLDMCYFFLSHSILKMIIEWNDSFHYLAYSILLSFRSFQLKYLIIQVPLQQVTTLDHPDFQDSFGKVWNNNKLANILEKKTLAHAIDMIKVYEGNLHS